MAFRHLPSVALVAAFALTGSMTTAFAQDQQPIAATTSIDLVSLENTDHKLLSASRAPVPQPRPESAWATGKDIQRTSDGIRMVGAPFVQTATKDLR